MNLKWFLLFIPVAIFLAWRNADPILVFITSALAIVPLAELMGDATDVLARFLGPSLGSLLNATLGNAPELIIGFFALKHGLVEMVRAAIIGSLIGNMLFGLGLSLLAGGLRSPKTWMTFDSTSARVYMGTLLLAIFGLIIPAMFNFTTTSEHEISVHIAVVMIVVYLISLILTLTTDAQDAASDKGTAPAETEHEEGGWSRNQSLGILAVVAIGLAVMSEIMTDAIDPAAKSLGLTPLFAGVFSSTDSPVILI